jgi:chorismate-pyruvate lyase
MKETVIIKQMRKKWSDKLMSEASMPDMDECWKRVIVIKNGAFKMGAKRQLQLSSSRFND